VFGVPTFQSARNPQILPTVPHLPLFCT